MNQAELYSNISTVSYVLAGILFLTAVALWVRLEILDVIDELSGRKHKRELNKLWEESGIDTAPVWKKSAGRKAAVQSWEPVQDHGPRMHSDALDWADTSLDDAPETDLGSRSGSDERGTVLTQMGADEDAVQTVLTQVGSDQEDGEVYTFLTHGGTMDEDEEVNTVLTPVGVTDVDEDTVTVLVELSGPGGTKLQILEQELLVHTQEHVF